MSTNDESQLAISVPFLQRVHELAGVGTYAVDSSRRRMRVSAEFAYLLGAGHRAIEMSTDEFIARYLHPDDREMAVQAGVKGHATGEDYRIECRYVRDDGAVVWLVSTSHRELDAHGEPILVGVAQDVTSRKHAELALAANEATLRLFIKHTPAAVAMFDEDMRYLQVSDRWLRDYRLEGQDLIGRSHYDVFPDLPERWKAVHRRALRGAVEGCDDDPYPRADGSMDWLQWEVRPWFDSQGRIGGISMLTQVTTRRKRAEQRLRESEERFRTLSENALVGVYVIQDARLAYVNPSLERTFGYGRGELIGKDPLTLFHLDDLAAAAAHTRARGDGEERDLRCEIRGIRKDGATIFVEVFGTAVEIEGRYAIIGNMLDVTDRVRAEEALRASEVRLRHAQKMEAVGVLAGGVAHDFNNLLTIILNCAWMLPRDAEFGGVAFPAVKGIQDAAERAAALTKQLLTFSRRQEQTLRTIDLDALVSRTVSMVHRLIGTHIDVVTVPGTDGAFIWADPGQIDQVLMNLAVNARDAMPEGGTLTITTERRELTTARAAELGLEPGPHVEMRVTDTGVGMDAATQRRIFEPFFTTKDPGKGTGLGLSTVFGIIRQSHGQIHVESRAGRGTTFRVLFPRVAGVHEPAATESIASFRGDETVLLVEDDAEVRKLTSALLVRGGYRVLEAASGGDALLLGEQYEGVIDVLLTDVVMPLLRGDMLAARLRKLRPEIRVVYMSGFPDKNRSDGETTGFTGPFVEKPFTPERLFCAIREALAMPRSAPPSGFVSIGQSAGTLGGDSTDTRKSRRTRAR